jgi:hypothetical protein
MPVISKLKKAYFDVCYDFDLTCTYLSNVCYSGPLDEQQQQQQWWMWNELYCE